MVGVVVDTVGYHNTANGTMAADAAGAAHVADVVDTMVAVTSTLLNEHCMYCSNRFVPVSVMMVPPAVVPMIGVTLLNATYGAGA